jgi:hypothetical protein
MQIIKENYGRLKDDEDLTFSFVGLRNPTIATCREPGNDLQRTLKISGAPREQHPPNDTRCCAFYSYLGAITGSTFVARRAGNVLGGRGDAGKQQRNRSEGCGVGRRDAV